jgi:hypothetical protein
VSVTEPVQPRQTSHATAIAAIVVVIAFIAGVLVGVVGDRVYMFRHGPFGDRRPGPFAAGRIVERLDRELKLTPEQERKVSGIVAEHGRRMEGIWANVRPQMRSEIEAANSEIAAVLTPEQRERFDKLKMRLGPRGGPRRGPRN